METRILSVDPADPDPAVLAEAAVVLQAGGLVAFPTETVYGLGADARSEAAVAGIYAAKGRPSVNPLIVHVADIAQAEEIASEWPAQAQQLAAAFWPGPLTLVVRRKPGMIADAAAAGGPTVALRMPAHPVALALLRVAGMPVAAPSANASGSVSPVRAEHVLKDLGGNIALILDGGIVPGGIESTVVDVSGDAPVLLRPGLLDATEIESLVGPLARVTQPAHGALPSPGMLEKHYAPRTKLVLSPRPDAAYGENVAVLVLDADADGERVIHMPMDPAAYAARLYDTLHLLDEEGLDLIIVEEPPDSPEWLAVRDRLKRAAA